MYVVRSDGREEGFGQCWYTVGITTDEMNFQMSFTKKGEGFGGGCGAGDDPLAVLAYCTEGVVGVGGGGLGRGDDPGVGEAPGEGG